MTLKTQYSNRTVTLNPDASVTLQEIASAPFDAPLVIQELQMIVKISSLVEVPYLDNESYMTAEEKASIFWRNAAQYESMGCKLHLQEHDSPVTEVLSFLIFNRKPYYMEDLLSRFTSRAEYVLAPGNKLFLQMFGTGRGVLAGDDRLTITSQCFNLVEV